MQRPKRGANLNAEIFQHQFAHLIAIHAGRDHYAKHVVHFVFQVAEGLQPHPLNAFQHRFTMQFVAGDAVIQPLLQDQTGAFARAKQRTGRFGVMVEPLRAPVIHDHAEIKIVGVDHLLFAILMRFRADPLLNAFAFADHRFHLCAQGDRRGTRWAAQTFLHPRRHRIQSPGVRFQRVTRQRRGGIGVEQHTILFADCAQLLQWLQHGRRGVALHGQQQARSHFFDRIFNLVRGKDFAPRHFNGVHFRATAAGNFAQQMTEAAKHRHQHFVARADR